MYSANTEQAYQDFQQKLDNLSSLIDQQIQVVKAINNPAQENNLKRLQEVVKSTNFKVMIVGEFNRGKSTFINALLGEEILPSSPTPTTAIINEVKWSETKNAILHYHEKDEQPSKEPFWVSIDKIEQYVVIDMKDRKESIYKKLELFWPLSFCKNGVEIIDSPGLNEDGIRQQVTEGYLSTVDAVLFILSCDQLFTDAERQVIDNKIRYAGHEDIFFVCNYINRIRSKEVEKVKQFALDKLSSRTRLGSQRIFFINALGALDGKIEDDLEALKNSGVLPLEVELQKFLTNDRGRVKILRPAQELKNSIREVRKSIPEQKDMLNTDIKELEQRYATAQQPLQNLEAKRNNIVKNLSNSMQDTEQVLSEKTKSFCRELAPKIKTIAQEYKLENKIKLLFTDPRPSIETAIKEISSHLESQIENEFKNWQCSELEPLMTGKMETIKNSLDYEATEFIQRIDNLRLEISGVSMSSIEISKQDIGVRSVSAVERILSAGGALLMGGVAGIGSATIGATFGYQEMLKSLIPQILISVLGIAFLGLNPITLVPMLIAGIVQGKMMEGGLEKKIKEEVGKKFSEKFQEATPDIIQKVVKGVSTELNKITDIVDEGLGAEIDNIRQQVNSVLAEKQKGQAEVNNRLKQLQNLEKIVNNIDSELDDLTNQWQYPK